MMQQHRFEPVVDQRDLTVPRPGGWPPPPIYTPAIGALEESGPVQAPALPSLPQEHKVDEPEDLSHGFGWGLECAPAQLILSSSSP